MALTDTALKAAKPRVEPWRLSDEKGLYVLIRPNGAKWWRFDYRSPETGKRKTLSFGTYPEVPLKLARDRRDEARKLVADGTDPSSKRKATKVAKANTFEVVAREWFEKRSGGWAKSHASKIIQCLERDLFPDLGTRPIEGIHPQEILHALEKIQARGALETAHRACNYAVRIFRFAAADRRCPFGFNPAADLSGSLKTVVRGHFATIIEPKKIGDLMRAIDSFEGMLSARAALRLAPLVFLRLGELRMAEWAEIDLDAARWIVPAKRMKMRRDHIVPLSRQALEILSALKPAASNPRYVFPGHSGRPYISDGTINAAIRRIGFSKDEFTHHGFRSMATTCLNEEGWNSDAIEMQMSHADKNRIRGIYNRAQYLDERIAMMQYWADYLDACRDNYPLPVRS
ncbi:tyrosine-type recombinase/integrase [Hydrocarboniphaga effusa]|uniref:tyrosine-type recombinase/integrase n=1 Tax=Hydrocarboniphaga effusa TaxID=243629 RepID=UPI0031383A49